MKFLIETEIDSSFTWKTEKEQNIQENINQFLNFYAVLLFIKLCIDC
jgi:hypothetical protein